MNAVKQALGGGGGGTRPPIPSPWPEPSTQPPSARPPTGGPPSGSCHAIGAWQGNAGMDKWCNENCARGKTVQGICVHVLEKARGLLSDKKYQTNHCSRGKENAY